MAGAAAATVVQELAARTGGDPPARYVVGDDKRPSGTVSPPPSPFPFIDLRILRPESDGRADELVKLRSALDSWGMFLVVGHGMEDDLIDEVQGVAKQFFHLPMKEKQKYSNLSETGGFRLEGYGNDRVLSEDQILDWNDRLYLLVYPESERNLTLWPESPTSFRNILCKFSVKCKAVVDDMLGAVAAVLNLEEEYFASKLGAKTTAYARFNYYPPCQRPDAVFGLKPHRDGPVLTVLLPDDTVPGLQLLKDDDWIDVPTSPYSLLINVGDMMEVMSNGIFRSPVHRVVTNAEKERISCSVFFMPGLEEEVAPADKVVGDGCPLYRKTTLKEYSDIFFRAFAEGKTPIDYLKL